MLLTAALTLAVAAPGYRVVFPDDYPGSPPGPPALTLDAVSVPLPAGAKTGRWCAEASAEGQPALLPAQASKLGPWNGGKGWVAFLRSFEGHGDVIVRPLALAEDDVETPYAWKLEERDGAVVFSLGGRELFSYVFEDRLREGVSERFRRNNYIHPIRSPGGVALTDDFPPDHDWHSGLFWRWPRIEWKGKTQSGWEFGGPTDRFEEWLGREAGPICAVLGARCGWYVEGERIADEEVWIRAWPVLGQGYAIDLALSIDAAGEGLSIGGAVPDKGYGGVSVRMAPREDGVVSLPTGPQADTYQAEGAWADYSGRFAGSTEPAGIAFWPTADLPGPAVRWFLRNYGLVGVAWPGLETAPVPTDEPLIIRTRVWVHEADANTGAVREAFASWRSLRDTALAPTW